MVFRLLNYYFKTIQLQIKEPYQGIHTISYYKVTENLAVEWVNLCFFSVLRVPYRCAYKCIFGEHPFQAHVGYVGFACLSSFYLYIQFRLIRLSKSLQIRLSDDPFKVY